MQAQTRSAQKMLELILKPASARLELGADANSPAFIQALPDGQFRQLSFKETEELIGRAESMLKAMGVKSSDRIVSFIRFFEQFG